MWFFFFIEVTFFTERLKFWHLQVDTKTALSHLAQIRVVGYSYKPEIAVQWGLSEENRHRVGVIAQELAEILPDAVTDNGDFLQVRNFFFGIFYICAFVADFNCFKKF